MDSKVSKAAKLISAAGVSEVPEAAVIRLPWKGVGSGNEIAVEKHTG